MTQPKRRDWQLSATQRQDARAAISILDGTGWTLAEAAQKALDTTPAATQGHDLSDVIRAFLIHRRTEKNNREATLDWYEREASMMLERFAGRKIGSITRREIAEYIESRSKGVRASAWRVVRGIIRFARSGVRPMLTIDPTEGLSWGQRRRADELHVLSVDQAGKLLRDGGQYRAAFAIALFAGVRPEEIAGRNKPPLKWSDIDIDARLVVVPAHIAKTRQMRAIEGLPDALWDWLETCPSKKGAISPAQFHSVGRFGRDLLGIDKWPRDITRHTFASYAVAHTGDAAKVALWLGHEGDQRILHRHYRGVVRMADAKEYFALRP